ncbi:fibronectin type III domain-containing protein [Streptomyces sp. HUAS MG91]|uniref:Fibronectin type III domain-containing protein n=1 Tax=Streptomyces tabacisoli TaxID=3156398 RepID=A0AAU8IS32_9ACTN
MLRRTAIAVSLALPMAVLSPAATQSARAADTPAAQPPPAACAGMTTPVADDENHASIRLDGPEQDAEFAVDEHGKITLNGVLHKQAAMVDLAVGRTTTTDFTLGPPPDGVAAWASSWTTTLRPGQIGKNLVCVRADREPKRHARILRSVTVVDRIAPSDVTGLTVGGITDTSAKVTWHAATDNYGLAGYDISIDGGAPHRTDTATRSYSVTGLKPTTGHTVSVVAVDLAGNRSKTPATASFTTLAPPKPPDPDAELSFAPEEGGALATWHPKIADGLTYRAYLDGEQIDTFPVDQYCQNADGTPADPCTEKSTIGYPIEPLEEATPYTFRVQEVAADGTAGRSFTGGFTTKTVDPEVDPAATQVLASESSQCAVRGGDFYLTQGVRAKVTVPAGATQIFDGCYKAADAGCVHDYLPPSGEKVMKCSDDVTKLIYSVAPAGRGPVISTVGDTPTLAAAGAGLAEPITWCVETACAEVIAEAEAIVAAAAEATAVGAATAWVVAAIEGIGIGIVLGVLLAVLFPSELGIDGVTEYPIHHDTDFDTFEDWGLNHGEWYNSLKIYAEVIKTTKTVTARDGLPFAWDNAADSQLKHTIDQACRAQRGTTGSAGCDEDVVVYVPGGTNYKGRVMDRTGTHIVQAMGDGGYPDPIGRAAWYYPGRSQGGQAARGAGYRRNWYYTNPKFKPNDCDGHVVGGGQTCDEFPFFSTDQAVDLSGLTASVRLVPTTESLPQAQDISSFYGKCKVTDKTKFVVLPVKPWVAAKAPSFGFRINAGGASMCMSPTAP